MSIRLKDRKEFQFDRETRQTVHVTLPACEQYVGQVVDRVVKTERIMSDVWADCTYAVVFDGSSIKEVYVGNSEFGYHGDLEGWEIDATLDTLAQYKAFKANQEVIRQHNEALAAEKRRQEAIEREAATPYKGRHVKVVRGRKVPIGTEGVVFWYGRNKFGYNPNDMRIGFKDAQGTVHWTCADNVEVVQSFQEVG